MSRRILILVFVAVGALVVLAAGCTRAKAPLGALEGAVGEAQATGTTTGGPSPAATQTTVAAGPSPTYEMPTLTPTTIPQPSATPAPTATCTPAAPGATPTPAPVQYTVQWGDTVFSLARRFGTTVEAIVQANNLANPNVIKVGQTLIIPGQPVSSNIYVVQPGDTLYSIATRHGISWQTLASVNGILNPTLLQVGQRLIIPSGGTTQPPPAGATTHVVKEGETLFRIALTYGTTVQAIAVANNLQNTHIIYPGQVLIIP